MEGVTFDARAVSSVEVVSEERMTEMGEVNADLMRASRFEAQTQKTVCAVCLYRFIMCACGLSAGSDMTQNDARQGTCNRCVDCAPCRREHTFDECKILSPEAVCTSDLILHLGMLCNEEQPCGIAVETVAGMKIERSAARLIESENGVGNGSVRFPRGRMDKLSCRLVEDEQVVILIDDRERDLLGHDRGDDGQII